MGGLPIGYIPKNDYEPINGSNIQTISALNGRFNLEGDGSWIQLIATEFIGETNTGSYLLDLTYGVWLNYVNVGEFTLINGNCWQSIFEWVGLKEMADEIAVTQPEFANYPYGGSWENTCMQLFYVSNGGLISPENPPSVIGEITSIDFTTDGSNSMGSETYTIALDGDFNGTGATFLIQAISSTEITVTIVTGGTGYNNGDMLFLNGNSEQAPNLNDDLYITITNVV